MVHLNGLTFTAWALLASKQNLNLFTQPDGSSRGSGGSIVVLAAAADDHAHKQYPSKNNVDALNLFQKLDKGEWADDDSSKIPHIGCEKFLKTNHDPQTLKAVNFRSKKDKKDRNKKDKKDKKDKKQNDGKKDKESDDKLRRAQVAASIPCINGLADNTYPCENVDLHSFIPLSELTPNDSINGNDIWGWTHGPSGREFALMGLTDSTVFVEITNPTDPQYVGFLFSHTTCSSWRDVKTHGNHAFVVSEASGHGMQIFDLTQLLSVEEDAMPVQFQETSHYGGFGNAHNVVINEDSGLAFGVGTNTFSGGLHIVDISDPTNPVAAGGFSEDGYTHDAQCVKYDGPDSGYTGSDICFNYNEDTLTIVDVTNRPNIIELGRVGYGSSAYTHQGWLTDDGKYVIVNDELDERQTAPATRTHVFNVENLENPTYINYHEGTTNAIDHNLYIKGNLVFEANYQAGLQVLRIDDASSASFTQVANFDIYPSGTTDSFNGAWSNYPYFPSGNVVVSGIEQGLFVLGSSNDWGAADGVRKRKLAPANNDFETGEQRRRRFLQEGCQVEDFESATAGGTAGWSTSGTCSSGTFVVGTPTQQISQCVVTQPGGDHTTGSGQALYSAPNSSPNGDDIDGGECVTTSPAYSIAQDSLLSAWFFHGQRDAGDDVNDYFVLEASLDNGASWTSMASIGDVATRATWTKATYEGAVLAGTELKLRVRSSDGNGGGDVVEAGIDDIVICPAGPPGPSTSPTPNPTASPSLPPPPPTKNPTMSPSLAPPPPCPGEAEIIVEILTDNYPSETSWTLTNTCDTDRIVASKPRGTYTARGEQYSESYCLPSGEHRFEIRDSFGDGICCGYGSGNYRVLYNGVAGAEGGEFASSETSSPFGSCGPVVTSPPTSPPTNFPTSSPTSKPTSAPSTTPTMFPTSAPTSTPSNSPSTSPTRAPTTAPTTSPPTDVPTSTPTTSPSRSPTRAPTNAPSTSPPTDVPTSNPTTSPSTSPTGEPTDSPTAPVPTKNPTPSPIKFPTSQPTTSPTNFPTTSPTTSPTSQSTSLPPTPTLVVATFDPSLGAPKCSTVGSSCTSGPQLLNGKGSNFEPNPPNSLDTCSDGSRGSYHSDESIDEIKVSSVDGGPLRGGAIAEIEAKVWAWSNGSADTADFYYAANANAPVWEFIASKRAGGPDLQTLKVQYSIPDGLLQAVRVNFRYLGSRKASACSGGAWDDVDDLVFSAAGAGTGTVAASAAKPPSVPPLTPMDSSYCATIDKFHKDRCVDICRWKNGRKRGCYPKK